MAVTARGIRIAVKVTPKAAADRIDGIVADADGRQRVKLSVTAPADRGRANAAVIAFLARALDLPASAVSLEHGASHRLKTVLIAGNGADLADRIGARLCAVACRPNEKKGE